MGMIAIQYIIAFAMAITNVFKKMVPGNVVPFISIGIAILLNVLNALLFGGDVLMAGKEAFIASGIMVGMFAAGDAVHKAESTKVPAQRK